jgi:hypothetical protein
MKRWHVVATTVIVILGAAFLFGYRAGVRLLQDRIVDALGPGSRLTGLKVNWFSIELLGVTIDAPKGWPAMHTLEAERVVIFPDLRSLLSDQIRISSIVMEKPYLSMLRTSGKLLMVPSLTEKDRNRDEPAAGSDSARAVTISTIKLTDGSLDLYDATVQRPPLKNHIEQIDAMIRDVTAPATTRVQFEITGIVKGIKRDGQAHLSGWIGPGAKDSSTRIALTAADLVALQPYLVKSNENRISRGIIDLTLNSEVRSNILDGKGRVTLKNLEFAPARGFFDTFMGLPRNAVIGFLKDHHDAIDVDFALKGDVKNPRFSLNEDLSTRIAMGMAGQLGVSVKNLAESLGTIGRKGAEGAGSVVEGVGSSIKRLFGSGK